MYLDFLTPMYIHPGPFASVYVDTSRSTENAPRAIELRWRGLREQLSAAGADEDTLAAVERVVGGDTGVPGPHGQAIFATAGQVVLTDVLPHPPDPDRATWASLPYPLPLLAARSERVPYVRVVIDRLGADVIAVGYDDQPRERHVEGEADYPIRKVHPGDWRQSHLQRAAEENWQHNAEQVAREVERLAAETAARVIVVAGDVRARAALAESLGPRTRQRVVEAETGSRAAGSDEKAVQETLLGAIRAEVAAEVADTVDELQRELGQRDRAVDGLRPVAAALRRAQVATLVLPADTELETPVWVGPDPLHVAVDQQELVGLGVQDVRRDRADAAFVRALAHADGELVIVPADAAGAAGPADLGLRDRVGAILRFADASTER